MAPHSRTLAWKIPWMEEPGGLQSMGREESDMTEQLHFHFSLSCLGEGNGNPLQCSCLESQGRWSLVDCHLWDHRVGHDWSDLAAAAARVRGEDIRGNKRSSYTLANSLEKTLMLGKTEDSRRWLDSITHAMDMNLGTLWEMMRDRENRHAAVHGFAESDTTWQLKNNNKCVLKGSKEGVLTRKDTYVTNRHIACCSSLLLILARSPPRALQKSRDSNHVFFSCFPFANS